MIADQLQMLPTDLQKYGVREEVGDRDAPHLRHDDIKIRLCKPMAELLKNPDNSKFVSLVLMASIDGVSCGERPGDAGP